MNSGHGLLWVKELQRKKGNVSDLCNLANTSSKDGGKDEFWSQERRILVFYGSKKMSFLGQRKLRNVSDLCNSSKTSSKGNSSCSGTLAWTQKDIALDITCQTISFSYKTIRGINLRTFQANRDAGIREAECEKAAMDIKYSTGEKVFPNPKICFRSSNCTVLMIWISSTAHVKTQ